MNISGLRSALLRLQNLYGDMEVSIAEVGVTPSKHRVVVSPVVAAKLKICSEAGEYDSVVLVTHYTEELVQED